MYFSVWYFPELKGKSWRERSRISAQINRKIGLFWKTTLWMIVALSAAIYLSGLAAQHQWKAEAVTATFFITLVVTWLPCWLYLVNGPARKIVNEFLDS